MHPWSRRLRALSWSALGRLGWLGARLPRTPRVYRVTVRGERLKRIVFPDSHQAALAASRLETFARDAIYPRPIFGSERELWVEFVEGRRVTEVDEKLCAAFARLLCVLMKRDPRRVPLAQTHWLWRLEADLDFLRRIGLLDASRAERLTERARGWAPPTVWEGYDCTDAILKNFVWSPSGRLWVVDVESLGAGQLLGWGAAKAAVRWLGPHRSMFLNELKDLGAPDFMSYFNFVELSFLAFWQKASFLERKWRFVDPALFEPLAGGA